jgi:3-oxoacid CoA-transferase subunit A
MIEYLSDAPAVYEFAGYKTLSIPGAYSVDKWYRLSRHWTWYEDEQLNEEEMLMGIRLVQQEKSFDLVISHTCPLIYEPRDLFLGGIDQSMVDKTMERYLGEIEYDLDYKRWAFGHFHADRLYPWDDGKQMLMLFNENVVDLVKFMEMKEENSLQDILA